MGAQPMGSPGWPELALFTPSIDRKRIVLMALNSSSSPALGGAISMVAAGAAALMTALRTARTAARRPSTSLAPLKVEPAAGMLAACLLHVGTAIAALLIVAGILADSSDKNLQVRIVLQANAAPLMFVVSFIFTRRGGGRESV